jgi:hypothetical protein
VLGSNPVRHRAVCVQCRRDVTLRGVSAQ